MGIQVVGIGGSMESASQSQRALASVLAACARRGAVTTTFSGADLNLPPYLPGAPVSTVAMTLLEAVRRSDAVVIASPGYHGTVSGMVKNALDYLEELRADPRPYLDGRAVGVVAVAKGWQASVATLGTLRQMAHALRGWPTPMGVVVNSAVAAFDEAGTIADSSVQRAVEVMAGQLVDFAGTFGRR